MMEQMRDIRYLQIKTLPAISAWIHLGFGIYEA